MTAATARQVRKDGVAAVPLGDIGGRTHSRHSTCKTMNLHESNTILDIPISAKHPQMHGPRSVFPGPVILGASDSF
jgi:hypothetical protein